MSDAELEAAIEEQALKPQSVNADGVGITRHSPTELREYAKGRRQDAAAANPAAFLQGITVKLVPPGAS